MIPKTSSIAPSVLVLDAAGESREVVAMMKAAGVHQGGFAYMVPKFHFYLVKVKRLTHRAANIFKQELLSLGHDAAVSEDVSMFREGTGDVIFGATKRAVEGLVEKLQEQPFGLRRLGGAVQKAVENYDRRIPSLALSRGRALALGERPVVLGILNVTPDSFSDGGKHMSLETALERGLKMIEEGADIVDVGGESSRPGARPVDAAEETSRVTPVIAALRKRSSALISVDTTKASVAQAAFDAGADILNDISAGRFDEAMFSAAARAEAPLILMHMQGTPETMQKAPAYEDLLFDVADFLAERAEAAESAGVSRQSIILDIGIGFGKTPEHSMSLLRRVNAFRSLGYPLLVGVSRKSFLGKILPARRPLAGGGAPVDERLEGGLAAQALAYLGGARFFRTHDVRNTRRCLDTLAAIERAEENLPRAFSMEPSDVGHAS